MSSIMDSEQDIMNCQLAKVLPVITGKWNMPIVYYLSFGTLRFGELKKKLPAMADSNFSKILRELEIAGVINRRDYKTVPPKVEYSLTDIGKQMIPIMKEIERFGKYYSKHIET